MTSRTIADRTMRLLCFFSTSTILVLAMLFSVRWAHPVLRGCFEAENARLGSLEDHERTMREEASVAKRLRGATATEVAEVVRQERTLRDEAFQREYPILAEGLKNTEFVALVRDEQGNLMLNEPTLQKFRRLWGLTSGESALAFVTFLVNAFLLIVLPLAFWLIVLREWKARSRTSYTFRFSLWPIAIFGWPLALVIASVTIDGYSRFEALLDAMAEALTLGAGLSALLAFLSLGLGSWFGGKRFPVGEPAAVAGSQSQ